MNWFQTFLEGWGLIFRVLAALWRRLLALLRELASGKRKPRPGVKDACCIHLPPDVRARPDPYIYSQSWLASRGLAVVWDNPDFRLVDPGTGLAAASWDLAPGTKYLLEATIHNGSLMAALGTTVHMEVLDFGVSTPVVEDLGFVTVAVPGGGSVVAAYTWTTPAGGGHRCLRATIVHPDDANPLNNVGQHNTDTAVPAGAARALTFTVANPGLAARLVRLEMDGYQLPARAMRADSFKERGSLAYLRKLQAANNRGKNPAPSDLVPTLSQSELRLEAGASVPVTIQLRSPPAGAGRRAVNINAYEQDRLLGGVTAYVEG